MGELEARNGNYRFIIWNYGERAELRMVRYDYMAEGLGVPFSDFSLNLPSVGVAKRTARKFDKAFSRYKAYNQNAF